MFILTASSCMIACKKEEPHDKLEGDMEALIGTWKWDHTVHTVEICAPEFTYTVTLTPESQNFDYYILIEQEGFINLYRDEQLISQHEVFINYHDFDSFGNLHFRIDLDNDETMIFSGGFISDTLRLNRYPFNQKEDYCIDYDNYFIRQ